MTASPMYRRGYDRRIRLPQRGGVYLPSSRVRRVIGESVAKVGVNPFHILVRRVKEGVGVVGAWN